jgi:hypothetical protein
MVMQDPDKLPLILFISLVLIAILVSAMILLPSPENKTPVKNEYGWVR